MAFIRTKTVNDKKYAQVVENYREGGKVKQRVLLHLGEYSPTRALYQWTLFARNHRNRDWQRWEAKVETLRGLIAQGKVSVDEDELRQLEARNTAFREYHDQLVGRAR